MKKIVDGVLMDMTPEEIEQVEKDAVNDKAREEAVKKANEDKANLKVSAKAKLVAGEVLTQEEADTIVL